MQLWKRFSDLTVTRFLRLGKGALLKITGADGTESTVDLGDLSKLEGVGAVIASGATVANIADASTNHSISSPFDSAEVKAALDALGGKINSVIAALEEFDISADS